MLENVYKSVFIVMYISGFYFYQHFKFWICIGYWLSFLMTAQLIVTPKVRVRGDNQVILKPLIRWYEAKGCKVLYASIYICLKSA